MPKPNEICVVSAGGQRYDIWQSVEVHRSTDDIIDHALLTVAENSSGAKNFAAIKLKPGDKASVTLAGQPALDGFVYLRQASYDANWHGVQIGICSSSQSVMPSTVDAKPGQYIKQTLQQIGSAVFGKVGVNFSVIADASEPFPRVSEHVGETRFAFIERLCRMRNIHMLDDGRGGIVGFRGPSGGGLVLQEGKNILRARLLLKNDDHVDPVVVVGQHHSNESADANRDTSGKASVPSINRPLKIPAEETGSDAAMQLRANHEADWIKYQMVDGDVAVPGWLTSDGSLWMAHVRELVTVNSPMLLPEDSMDFMIKGVVHRQSSEGGTTTDVLLCRFDGLGAGGEPLIMDKGGKATH
jgi:prophage tail gpP-like protein